MRTQALGHVVGVGTPLHHRDGRTFANRDELGVLARGLLHEYAVFIVAANEVVPDEAAGEGDRAVPVVVFAGVVGLDDGVHAHLVGQGACNRHAGADVFGGRELRAIKGRQGGVDLIGGGFDRDETVLVQLDRPAAADAVDRHLSRFNLEARARACLKAADGARGRAFGNRERYAVADRHAAVLGGLTGLGRGKPDGVDPAVTAHRPRRRFVEGDVYRRLLGDVHAAGPGRAVLEADDVFAGGIFFFDGFAQRSPVQVDLVLEVARPVGLGEDDFRIVCLANLVIVAAALTKRVELIDDGSGKRALTEIENRLVFKLLAFVFVEAAIPVPLDEVGGISEDDAFRQRQSRLLKTET